MPELTAIDALELISARVRPTSTPGETDAALQVIGRRLAQISALEGRCQGMAEGAEYVRRELDRVRAERDRLQSMLRDCDAVARRIGDPYGLCDDVDNDGSPYQSAALEALLREDT